MQISIHTSGDELGAGMRRGVGLELHGSANVAGPIMLDNDGAYFGAWLLTLILFSDDMGSTAALLPW